PLSLGLQLAPERTGTIGRVALFACLALDPDVEIVKRSESSLILTLLANARIGCAAGVAGEPGDASGPALERLAYARVTEHRAEPAELIVDQSVHRIEQ